MRYQTELPYELMDVHFKIPVDIVYEYWPAVPEGRFAPRDPAVVEVKAIHWRIGLHEKRDITFLFPDKSGIEQAILEDETEKRAA